MDSITQVAQQNIELQLPTIQEDAPWLLTNGMATPDNHLKTLTPLWSADTWEKYLSWFESISGQRAESLLLPKKYIEICDAEAEPVFVFAQGSANEDLRNFVGKYLDMLTTPQRQVVEMIFWKGRSERYVAEKLGIRKQSVNRLKRRALSKIKELIREGVGSRIMRRECSHLVKGVKDEKSLSLAENRMGKAS